MLSQLSFYALFIAFSRVYLGVHTISQVAAGLALAFFACVLAELAFRMMKWEVPQAIHIKHAAGKLLHASTAISAKLPKLTITVPIHIIIAPAICTNPIIKITPTIR